MTTKSRLGIGDRVIERSNQGVHVATPSSPGFSDFVRCVSEIRHGKVTELVIDRNSRGYTTTYAMVVWDGLQSPRKHAVNRLLKAD
jgi:hypothetical protein